MAVEFEIGRAEGHLSSGLGAETQLEGIARRLEHLHPVLEEIVDDIHEQTLKQFVSRGRELGDPWAPLAESTIASKEGRYPFPDWPLVATGAMMASATGNEGPYSEGETLEQEAWLTLDWERDGWSIPLLHQIGVPWREVTQHRHRRDGTAYTVTYMWHLPSRPFWEATDELADRGAEQIAAYVFNPLA